MNNDTNVARFCDSNGNLLAYKIGTTLVGGLSAYSQDEDFIQVLSWNYPSGKLLQSHTHLIVERSSSRTQEAIVVLSGRLKVNLFSEDRQLLAAVFVSAHECMVFLGGGHGYEILENDTKVIEVKNGPFLGVEIDKQKF